MKLTQRDIEDRISAIQHNADYLLQLLVNNQEPKLERLKQTLKMVSKTARQLLDHID